jgi:DNA-3-methyladenine glycosylase II
MMSDQEKEEVAAYVTEIFDLSRDLGAFYHHMENDAVMGALVKSYFGLRMIGVPDLFEALCWSIIGQQINLTFAYKLKRRLVESKGEKMVYMDQTHYLFPAPETVATMSPDDFGPWQYTASKARYIIGIAKELSSGNLNKQDLEQMSDNQILNRLISLLGIGPWSANYVMMKCLKMGSAFPLADVGLQNAIKMQMGLAQKPTRTMLEDLGRSWHPWEAYATFYLWHSLIK